jgi:hypothetical protein
MAATIRRSSQNSNVYGAYGIVSSDSGCADSVAELCRKEGINDIDQEVAGEAVVPYSPGVRATATSRRADRRRRSAWRPAG